MIIDPDFPDHWKVQMLSGLLGDDPAAPVYLIRLWGHCQNRKKDRFDNLPAMGLRAICKFRGDADTLESALIECGFVERDNGSLVVIGWMEHNANLWSAWENGKKGGRPKKPNKNPRDNPSDNQQVTGRSPDEVDEGDEEEKHSSIAECASPDGEAPDPTPHAKILELFHSRCPSLPKVVKLTPARKQALRARWRNDLQSLDDWERYFAVVEQSDFLTGRVKPSGGRETPWTADLDFLLKQGNCVKIMEGRYD